MAVPDRALGEPLVQAAGPSRARSVGKVVAGLSLLLGLSCAALWVHAEYVQRSNYGADLDETTLAKIGVGTTPGNFVQLFPPPSSSPKGGMAQVQFMENTLKKYGVGSSPMQKLALTQLAATRDASMKAQVREAFSGLDPTSQEKMRTISKEIVVRANRQLGPYPQQTEPDAIRTMAPAGAKGFAEIKSKMANDLKGTPGVTPPFGFWDPLDLSVNIPDARLTFYREAELKHGRISMMAVLGIIAADKFHPFYSGAEPYVSAVQSHFTPEAAKNFWPSLVIACGFAEFFSSPNGSKPPGDLGFDPLGLRPTDPKEYSELQNKEINNGRLAMFAWAGIVGGELMTGARAF